MHFFQEVTDKRNHRTYFYLQHVVSELLNCIFIIYIPGGIFCTSEEHKEIIHKIKGLIVRARSGLSSVYSHGAAEGQRDL